MSAAEFDQAVNVLLDPSAALDVRIRALYVIKQPKDEGSVDALLAAIDTTDSVLLQHEILYNLGQFGRSDVCLRRLEAVATDAAKYNEVSRHEAIEAIGAIARPESTAFLTELAAASTDNAPVRESCLIALDRIKLRESMGDAAYDALVSKEFHSVDPAPAAAERDVAKLKEMLLDPAASLFDRYRAMFALRDIRTPAAIAVLAEALRADQSSCLFRHEVAFVLGQLEAPATIPALIESLKDESEHGMVRHESAEALGAMADAATWDLLTQFAGDDNALVRDSCVVALEMHRYWSQWKPSSTTATTEVTATA